MEDTGPPHRITLPMDFTYKSVNAYLFPRPEPVLVDCGLNTPASKSALEIGLAAFNLRIDDIQRVIVTHPHIDHFGLAAAIVEQSGAEIWVSELAVEHTIQMEAQGEDYARFLVDVLARYGFSQQAQQSFAGYMRSLNYLRRDVPDESLVAFPAGGEISFGGHGWQVIYAPGHSNRQTCFYQPDTGACLAADMLLPRAPAPVVEPDLRDPGQRSRGLPRLLQSYRMFAELSIKQVYPGHGEPFQDHANVIGRQQARISRRKRDCLALIQDGCSQAPDLLEKMYSYLPQQGRLSGLGMLLGYLDLLRAEDAIRAEPGRHGWEFVPRG